MGSILMVPISVAGIEKIDAIIRLLHELRVDLNKPNNEGATPIFLAAENGHNLVVRTLQELGMSVSPLFLALNDDLINQVVSQQTREALRQVRVGKKDINALLQINRRRIAIIHQVAREGNVQVLKVLIQLGADVNREDSEGYTPASEAAENGHVEVIRALHQAGADLNIPNNDGLTPAYIAAQKGHVELMRALHQSGAHIE